jgi:hypothetical protein
MFHTITHVQGELPMADANIFEFTGEDVQISYSARGPFIDQPGLQPTITYQDSDKTLTFSGDQIRTQQSEMGSLVSVTLLPSVDAGATILTILLPSIHMGDMAEQPFETFAIVSKSFGMLPRVGASQVYNVMQLNGVGRFMPIL